MAVGLVLSDVARTLAVSHLLLPKELIGGGLGEKLVDADAEMAERFSGVVEDGAEDAGMLAEGAVVIENLAGVVDVRDMDIQLELFSVLPELAVEVGLGVAVLGDKVTAESGLEGGGEGVKVAGEVEIGIQEDGSDVEGIDVRDHRQDSFANRLGFYFTAKEGEMQEILVGRRR